MYPQVQYSLVYILLILKATYSGGKYWTFWENAVDFSSG